MSGKHSSLSSSADPQAPKSAEPYGGSLTNHLLIAMPQLLDPNFAQTVAIICEHTDKGALGIVLNKPRSRCCGADPCTPIAASYCIGPVVSGTTLTKSPTPFR